ncbi:MAG: DUF4491 family protein [Spirochaetales bacterium]|nr:DUF4491 family protein [Spirochaetales bacterium]
MVFEPLFIGLSAFLIIGLFHPIVIKSEYYFSYRIWPFFLVVGLVLCVLSVVHFWSMIINCILAITGFTCLWTIKELFEQRERVAKGWFPENKNRTKSRKEPDKESAKDRE